MDELISFIEAANYSFSLGDQEIAYLSVWEVFTLDSDRKAPVRIFGDKPIPDQMGFIYNELPV